MLSQLRPALMSLLREGHSVLGAGQVDVDEQQSDVGSGPKDLKPGLGARGLEHRVPLRFEECHGRGPHQGIVFHDENSLRVHAEGTPARLASSSALVRMVCGELRTSIRCAHADLSPRALGGAARHPALRRETRWPPGRTQRAPARLAWDVS